MKNHEHKDHSKHMRILQKTLSNLYIRNSASENKSAGNWENFQRFPPATKWHRSAKLRRRKKLEGASTFAIENH